MATIINIINTWTNVIKIFIFTCKLENYNTVFRECVVQIKYFKKLDLDSLYLCSPHNEICYLIFVGRIDDHHCLSFFIIMESNFVHAMRRSARRGRNRMVVGFTTTCTISAYHHCSCEFEPRSWWGVLDTILSDKVCQWLATGRWFSSGTPVSSTNKMTATI